MGVHACRRRGPWAAPRPVLLVVVALHLLGPAARAEEQGADRPVAKVGRETLTTSDLVAHWFARHRDEWARTVDSLIDERIVVHEVRRLGLRLPPGVLERGLQAEIEKRREQLRSTFGEEADLEAEVRNAYGMGVEDWKEKILAPRLRTALLLQRVVRLDTRRRDRVKVRVIVLDARERADRVLGKLRAGADFSLTALQESIDPTARLGGDLPAIARGDLVLPGIEESIFQAGPGQLVGPLPVDVEGRRTWHIYKVVGRLAPWTGSREAILAQLEADLSDHPIERPEFERWRARMRRDFHVQVLDPEGREVVLPSGS